MEEKRIELEEKFKIMPAAQFLNMELINLNEEMAEVSLPLKKEFLTHHGLIVGYVLFAAANLAGVFTAMARVESSEVVLQRIISGQYLEATRLEEKILVAKAKITDEQNWINKNGREHRKIEVKVDITNGEGREKATFSLLYALNKTKSLL